MAKATAKVGDIVKVTLDLSPAIKVTRPLIVTSVNKDGTVNGRVIIEPGDNPGNDGNFQTFLTNVEV